jgi:hypothetical protein
MRQAVRRVVGQVLDGLRRTFFPEAGIGTAVPGKILRRRDKGEKEEYRQGKGPDGHDSNVVNDALHFGEFQNITYKVNQSFQPLHMPVLRK